MKIAIVLAATLVMQAGPADSLRVERKVHANALVSKSLPAATLRFAQAFKYVGAQRVILSGMADAEQHFFVDADKTGNVRRFYWVQFEHRLPTDTHTYNYQPVRTTQVGPLEFIHDTKLFTDYAAAEASEKGSDSAYMSKFLDNAGFRLPKEVRRIRMFNLPSDRRSELMIIYVEALAPGELPAGVTGETPADVPFPSVAATILEHIKANLKITSP
jgi:hypothetical protein